MSREERSSRPGSEDRGFVGGCLGRVGRPWGENRYSRATHSTGSWRLRPWGLVVSGGALLGLEVEGGVTEVTGLGIWAPLSPGLRTPSATKAHPVSTSSLTPWAQCLGGDPG